MKSNVVLMVGERVVYADMSDFYSITLYVDGEKKYIDFFKEEENERK